MENKDLVTDVTENVEQATEELVDGAKEVEVVENEPTVEAPLAETFTKEQVDEMIAKKLARKEAKIRKDYEKKYGRLENVLKAGTGVESVEEMADTFTDFYTKQYERKGLKFEPSSTPHYSERDMAYLAERDANEIIEAGYDDIVEEVDRLADVGAENMTAQEKLIFTKLAKERTRIESERELASIGVTKLDDDFKDFANKLNPSLSMKEKYEMYVKLNPKKKGEMMGSMKSNTIKDNGVKEFYTREEALQFTKADFDRNPALFKAVENSMTRW